MGDQIPGQIELLDYLTELEEASKKPYKITKPIRAISLFSGIGAQIAALNKLDYPVEDYKTSEWDVNAIRMYNAMHCRDYTDYSEEMSVDELVDWLDMKGVSVDGKSPLLKDKIKRKGEKWIRETYNNYIATHKIGSIFNAKGSDLEIKDTGNYEYIVFYSFPCQDLSVAGKQAGMSQDSGSRSSLLWHVERLLKECDEKPQVLIMENVSQVHGKKFIDDWNRWLKALDNLGYKTFWEDLNAKDYGIAQNRLRTFAVSILNKNVAYKFSEPIELTRCMKDYLEDHVDEKYYINTDKAKKLIQQLIDRGELPKPGEKEAIDFTINDPHIINTANCLKARMDASIVNFKQDGTGVIETILMENMGGKDKEPNCKTTTCANTLMARDYKGTPNQYFNGVVECKE